MKYIFFFLFSYSVIYSLEGQRQVTTRSGQTLTILPDGSWQPYTDTIQHKIEIPFKEYMTSEIIEKFRNLIKAAEIKEIQAFMDIDSLNKELDNKKMKFSQAKRLKNKITQRALDNEIKIIKEKLEKVEKQYVSASHQVDAIKKLKEIDELDAFLKKFQWMAHEMGESYNEAGSMTKNEENITIPSQDKQITVKAKSMDVECYITKDHRDEKNRIIEFKKEEIFAYTPEKLRNYFKDKNLMVSEVNVVAENNKTKLRIYFKLISKDASKNYGHIPQNALMRITLISGKKIDIYSMETSYGDLENYTGHVIYKADFLVNDSEIKNLSDVPLDTVGLMWTSGFESYPIYNVDVLMKQLACLKKLKN